MGRTSKTFALLLTLIILMSCLTLLIVKPTNAQTATPTLEWSKTYGPVGGHGILQTNDDGYIIAGVNSTFKPFAPHSPSGYVNYTGLLLRIDSEGSLSWEKTFGRKLIYSIAQTNDGGYLLCGDGDWLIKVDSNGNEEWEKSLGVGYINSTFEFSTVEYNHIYAVGDGYVLEGRLISEVVAGYNSVVIKIDSTGNMLWNTKFLVGTLTGPQYVDIYSFAETNEGRYIVAGDWNGHAWLAEVDTNGDLVLNKTYSNSYLNFFTSCIIDNNGQLILTSSKNYFTPNEPDIVNFVQIDSDRNIISNKKSDSDSSLSQLQQDINGNYIALSRTSLMGFDATGTLIWNASLTGNPYLFIINKEGNYVVTGIQPYDDGLQVKFFVQELSLASASAPSTLISSLTVSFIVFVLVLTLAIVFLLLRRHRKTTN